MTPTLLKYNVVILIVLSIGMTLIHNSSQTGDGNTIQKKKVDLMDYTPGSPSGISVSLTAKALDLEINFIPINYYYFYLNPQRDVPTLLDGEFVLWESRAIIVYLVETYGGDDHPLFPKDTKMRARINQRLQYDLGTLYPTFVNQYYRWLFNDEPRTYEKEKEIHVALEFLEIFLKSSKWVAGSSMTLADISLVVTISTFEVFGVDLNRYEHISKWLQMCKTEVVGYEEINQLRVNRFKALIDQKPTVSVSPKVTKKEIFAAIQVLRKAVTDQVIGEQHSDSIKTLESAGILVV